MIRIDVNVDLSELEDTLTRIVNAGQNTTPLMAAAAGVMEYAVFQAFHKERDPVTGTPWARLSPVTLARRKGAGKILQPTGGAAFARPFSPGPHLGQGQGHSRDSKQPLNSFFPHLHPRMARSRTIMLSPAPHQRGFFMPSSPMPRPRPCYSMAHITLREGDIMKRIFAALLLVVLMAGAAWGTEDDDEGNAFINNVILITIDDDDIDGKQLEKYVTAIIAKVSTPAVLGEVAPKVSISTLSSITLSEIYKVKEYPKFTQYKNDVRNLYSEMRTIKMSKKFATQGIGTLTAKAWLKKCKEKEKQYEKAKLPPRLKGGFSNLHSLLCEYGRIRINAVTLDNLHQNEEMIAIHRKYVENINNAMTDD